MNCEHKELREAELRYERDQAVRLAELAGEIAKECPWAWSWGDGDGGYVVAVVRRAFENAGVRSR